MKVVTSLPLLLYKLSVSVKGILDRKKIAESSDFAENSNFIRGNREAGEVIGLKSVTLSHKDSVTDVFLKNLHKFSEKLFLQNTYELWTAASGSSK